MQTIVESIKELYTTWSGGPADRVEVLPQSGSDRRYFRVYDKDNTYIATHGNNIPENETFIYFSDHFKERSLPVPQVLAISEDKTIYLQEDFGDISLLNRLEGEGLCDEVYALFRDSLHQLALLQVKGHEGLDYTRCLTNQEFGKQAIMADLLYFKYYFLDALRKPYDKQKLIDDFEALSTYLTFTEYKYFMFRDFQSRNILVKDDNTVHFIDYQGGMRGAPQYDAASMIWQARANLPDDWKSNLLNDYMDSFESIIGQPIDKGIFKSQYNGYVLIRLLQVLGAYGFRGLFERKAQFLTSIPQALHNLKWFIENQSLGIAVPEFRKVLDICVGDDIIERFTPLTASENTPLVVHVSSFSYKKGGIPSDESENGGGFVFDCRGILNPGRLEEFKCQTGRDKGVKDFLEQQTRMPEYLNSVFDIVDIAVEDYIRRGFDSLMVSFGCTGGQHRSVYAADALARHLRNKFKVSIQLKHHIQDAKNWVNT
ncbi:RNase adapter RapZ [Paraflavitalea sp. CAU 1676]|uniref:RapZ C-terminal domain-containing protein n=1 Tax=Paraflavitalea sp. CAU 1676 TaxID=3032598 RepID=UPI0023D9CE2D|nr:RNase adapter RapZ [Paraflavitalea sp. CAU 1676]MDF2186996.1 RNase adapter RapZ [Paraflavitalea sp. CAU 1676]